MCVCASNFVVLWCTCALVRSHSPAPSTWTPARRPGRATPPRFRRRRARTTEAPGDRCHTKSSSSSSSSSSSNSSSNVCDEKTQLRHTHRQQPNTALACLQQEKERKHSKAEREEGPTDLCVTKRGSDVVKASSPGRRDRTRAAAAASAEGRGVCPVHSSEGEDGSD